MTADADRRKDGTTRSRLGEMERGYAQFRARALRIARWMRWIAAGNVVIGVVVAALGTYGYISLRDLGQRNREGIHVSCVLLGNAIIQSGASAATGGDSPRVKLSELYTRIIARAMTAPEIAEARRLAARIKPITLPSCDDVALHPERVKALDLTQRR